LANEQISSRVAVEGGTRTSLIRLLIKIGILLLLINVIFALFDPIHLIGKLSLYNSIFPGRLRLPYGDDPELSFNPTVNHVDAMFASHILSGDPKDASEYRVILIGDSSVWGFLQEPDETLAAALSRTKLYASDGRSVRFYNLGYPTMSLTKDLLLLDYAQRYQPDLILWFITLEAVPVQKQSDSPILSLNPEAVRDVLDRSELRLENVESTLTLPDFWQKTVIGRRRMLAELIRHQIYGVLWTATGVDHHIPATYNLRTEDLSDDLAFQDMDPESFSASDMAFEVLQSGIELSSAPIIFINEPIFISEGKNSDIRYNFYYPIWAYDLYHSTLVNEAQARGWTLVDLWNLLPGEVFTDSAIHYNLEGVQQVITALLSSGCLPFTND
jgi:hypothetical protein